MKKIGAVAFVVPLTNLGIVIENRNTELLQSAAYDGGVVLPHTSWLAQCTPFINLRVSAFSAMQGSVRSKKYTGKMELLNHLLSSVETGSASLVFLN